MIVKSIISVFLMVGVLFPEPFSNFTEAWKLRKRSFTPRYLAVVRISCVVAIVAVWWWL